mmetsp:Transcript_52238/g.167464  ORF Transcript_52238/g.167464 Transcript_52238/m.167464 type:complete len:449 (-) Transcript_52238:269-1615(-)
MRVDCCSSCVTSSTHSCGPTSRSSTMRLEASSKALVGSSKTKQVGFCARAMASMTRCASPPESSFQGRSKCASVRPRASRPGATSSAGRWRLTFSLPRVLNRSAGASGNGALLWCTYMTSRRQCCGVRARCSCPAKDIEPPPGAWRSQIHFRRVDLPMPLGPMIQATSPAFSSSLAWRGREPATRPSRSRESTLGPSSGVPCARALIRNSIGPMGLFSPPPVASNGSDLPDLDAEAGFLLQVLRSKSWATLMRVWGTMCCVWWRPLASKKDRIVRRLMKTTAAKEQPEMRKVMAIWYFAAFMGGAPPRIWPVIMPGMDTRPMTFMPLIAGIRAACTAFTKPGHDASHGVAPKARRTSTYSLRAVRWSIMPFKAKATPESALLMSMPARGMTYCALYQGVGSTTASSTQPMTSNAPPTLQAACQNMPGYVTFGRAAASYADTSTMKPKM